MSTQLKIEDLRQYVIRDKQTKALWSTEVYLSVSGAKTSFYHASPHYIGDDWRKRTKFDDQDKYEVVKVKLVVADE